MTSESWIFTTGGQGGIGQGILSILKQRGYRIADCGRASKPQSSLPDLYFTCDVTKEKEVESVFLSLHDKGIFLKGLIHGAGSTGKSVGLPFTRIDPDDFDRCFALHNKAFFYLMKYALPLLDPSGASVVALSSIAAIKNGESLLPYAASKAALNTMVQCFARELAEKKIRVNAVAPGFVWSPLWNDLAGEYLYGAGNMEERKALFLKVSEKRTLMKKPQTPEEIGALAEFLISDQSRGMTGQILYADGGASVI